MSLPEYVGPILAHGGPAALVLAFVILRFGPRELLRLMAGTVGIFTNNDKRGQRCLEMLRILYGRDQSPPSLPSNSLPERLPEARSRRPESLWRRILRYVRATPGEREH